MGKFQARIYCSWHLLCWIKYPARLIMNNVILMRNLSAPQAPPRLGAMTRWSPGRSPPSRLTSSRGWPPPGRGRPSPPRPGPARGRGPATSWRRPWRRELTGPRHPARSARNLMPLLMTKFSDETVLCFSRELWPGPQVQWSLWMWAARWTVAWSGEARGGRQWPEVRGHTAPGPGPSLSRGHTARGPGPGVTRGHTRPAPAARTASSTDRWPASSRPRPRKRPPARQPRRRCRENIQGETSTTSRTMRPRTQKTSLGNILNYLLLHLMLSVRYQIPR